MPSNILRTFAALALALGAGGCLLPIATSNRLSPGKRMEPGTVETALAVHVDRVMVPPVQNDHPGAVFLGADLFARVGILERVTLEADLALSPPFPFPLPIIPSGFGIGGRVLAVEEPEMDLTLEIAPRLVRWNGAINDITIRLKNSSSTVPGSDFTALGGELALVAAWRPASAVTVTIAPFGRFVRLGQKPRNKNEEGTGIAFGAGAALSATFLLGVVEIMPGVAVERAFFMNTSAGITEEQKRAHSEWAPEPILGLGLVF